MKRIRIVRITLCTVALLCCLATPGAAQFSQAVLNKGSKATVRIYVDGSMAGSGTLVHSRYVLTSYHVVEQADRLSIKPYSSTTRIRGELVAWSAKRDLALLKLARSLPHVIPIAKMRTSKYVAEIAYPEGSFAINRTAIMDTQFYRYKLMRTSTYILKHHNEPGSSGGLVMAPNGTLIGVHYGRSRDNRGIAVSLSSIHSFLKHEHYSFLITGRGRVAGSPLRSYGKSSPGRSPSSSPGTSPRSSRSQTQEEIVDEIYALLREIRGTLRKRRR